MDDFFDDDSFFGGNIDADRDLGEEPKDTQFYSWHRPRKQWIRSKQWWGEIDLLRKEKDYEGYSSLNMLSLTGGELLDFRYFLSKLQASNIDDECSNYASHLRLVSFISDSNDFELANKNLPFIGISEDAQRETIIRPDNLDKVADRGLAYNNMVKYGPYSVINLDYCSSIAPPSPGSRFNSIYQILTAQFNTQSRPWLLMVTTRTSATSICGDIANQLFDIVDNNIAESIDFQSEFMDWFSDFLEESNFRLKYPNEKDEKYSTILALGFIKWMTGIAVETHSFDVKLRSIVRYQIDGEDADSDMFSIVIRFKKKYFTDGDPNNLVQAEEERPADWNEASVASRFVKKISNAKKVEEILQQDREAYYDLSCELASLLEECGKCTDTFWRNVFRSEVEKLGWDYESFLG